MKVFDLTDTNTKGETIVHLKTNQSNFKTTYKNGKMIFENDSLKYIVPTDKGNRLMFFRGDENTGTLKYDVASLEKLYRDSTPTDFGINDILNVPPKSKHLTKNITVGGVSHRVMVLAPLNVKIFVNNKPVSSGKTVFNGDVVKFEVTAPPTFNTVKKINLSIGDLSKNFNISTIKG